MATGRRRLGATAVVVSIAVHAVVLVLLARHAPTLFVPRELAGPPEPIIPVIIMPRAPPPVPGSGSKPEPIRLHRRQLRPQAEPPPMAPLVLPSKAEAAPPPRPGPAARRATVQPSPAARLGEVLRASSIGCANPSTLSPAERERCDERLGRGAKDAPVIPAPIDPAKRARYDAARAARASGGAAPQARAIGALGLLESPAP